MVIIIPNSMVVKLMLKWLSWLLDCNIITCFCGFWKNHSMRTTSSQKPALLLPNEVVSQQGCFLEAFLEAGREVVVAQVQGTLPLVPSSIELPQRSLVKPQLSPRLVSSWQHSPTVLSGANGVPWSICMCEYLHIWTVSPKPACLCTHKCDRQEHRMKNGVHAYNVEPI